MLANSAVVRKQVESALATRHPSALTVFQRPRPECFSTGVPQIDGLTGFGGIPRGALSEICGPASSGRTSVMLSLLAEATRKEEFCGLVDASDSFSPHSAAEAGLDLQRLLWVRCSENVRQEGFGKKTNERKSFSRLEQTLKTTDQLLQSGGFGLIVVDLGDLPPQIARRVPLTSWFRFRRAVENTRTALVVIEQEAYARTCATLVLHLRPTERQAKWSSLLSPEFYSTSPMRCASPLTHSRLLRGLEMDVEVMRARVGSNELRKPVSSAVSTQSEWNVANAR